MVSQNLLGIGATDLTPDLAGFDIAAFLGGLRMAPSIEVRHTVGLVDPIAAADQKPERARRTTACPRRSRRSCATIAGAITSSRSAATLRPISTGSPASPPCSTASCRDYRATLDGNEQYESVEGIAELWRRMRETPALRAARLLDPLHRAADQAAGGARAARSRALADEKPLEIDELDGELSSFPAALALGYTGVSSKNCKGFYKSILNAARVAKLNAEAGRPRYFMSAEDLTTWAGVSVQQDLCLVSLLGLTHVERNGHHFIDGMSFAPEGEQAAFAAAHPDLYDEGGGGPARLRIEDGASLDRLARLPRLRGRGAARLLLHAPDAGGAARADRARACAAGE